MEKKKRITLKTSMVNEKKKREKAKRVHGNNPLGRPQIYNDMIGAYICRELQMGRTITSISKDKDIPSLPTIYNWLNPLHPNYNEDFLKSYVMARKIQAETLADEALDIADSEDTREYEDKSYDSKGKLYNKRVYQKDIINSKQLKIDTRFKAAKYLYPNKYSDKVQLTGNDGKDLMPITPTKIIYNFIKAEKK